MIAYSDNGHILIFSTKAQLHSKCAFINRYGLIKDVTIFYKVVSLIHNTGENINNFHDSHWWDPSLSTGGCGRRKFLFCPFCGDTDTCTCFVSKPELIPCLPASLPACDGLIRFPLV